MPSEPGKAYTSCNDLPLYNFIQISLTNDLNWLTISGRPGNLTEVWADIMGEFSDMSDNPQMNEVFKLRKKIAYLSNKIDIVNILLNHLSLSQNIEVVKLLNTLGYAFLFDTYEKYSAKVRSRLNNDSAKLRLALSDYAKEIKGSDEKTTLKDWEDELFELAKYSGFQINKKKTTVSEYLSIKRSFKEYVEYLKKNKGG